MRIMFFIGIFGIETKDQEIGPLTPISCKGCQQTVPMTLFKHFYVFHFFFIPLIKWKTTYYVVCSNCQTIAIIDKEKGQAIEAGEQSSLTFWDLEPLQSQMSSALTHCKHCGKQIDSTYDYCPHCGTPQ